MEFKEIKKFLYGVDTLPELFLGYADYIFNKVFHARSDSYVRVRAKRFRKKFFNEAENIYQIKDIKFPLLDFETEKSLWSVMEDSLTSYMLFNDKYDEATFDKCDKFLQEGLYGLVNEKVNVTVKPGDIVIDAGSWIGDFAAYAAVKNALAVYAFEPAEDTFKYLQKTAELNGNIIPVKKGLSNENTTTPLFSDTAGSTSSANSLMNKDNDKNFINAGSVETVRLDDFVRENNLPSVDFIKADIEGFERYMLEGAQETLKNFAPKLALCTYHLPDDPQVLEALIKKANPKYNIVQKKKKLFASVPNS